MEEKDYPELSDPKWIMDLVFLVDMLCHLDRLNLALQGFATQRFLVYDAVISCQLTCDVFILHLFSDPPHQSTLLTAHRRRSICCQSNKFIPRQPHFIYTSGHLFKEIFPRSCAMH
ncbi:hypothetical protein NHX12_025973 [Muraenolepis orangiensis]|uniref:Uncharacterized protein n=1 Tax=Muraenolepis orangiensis TaxID=630683 RepID=A0A9Q0ELB0_9TELE|nr:hypothetical protein NHX12_025973 [Muraenolepis orangiensis]